MKKRIVLGILLAAGAAFVPTAGAAPFIQDTAIESCRNVGVAGKMALGQALFRVDIPTSVYPLATCNDGTPAVMYVRRAKKKRFANSWVIFLQGGGTCTSGQSCGERYCSIDTNFGAWKMSSLDVPPNGAYMGGIHARRRSKFRGWNHVFVHYCSSDGWSGTRSDVDLQMVDGTGTTIDYRVNFHGAHIFDAVIDTLRGGAGPVTYIDHRERLQTLPDLDEAETVLLGGSSAGSAGARRQVDRLRSLLVANNVNCPPLPPIDEELPPGEEPLPGGPCPLDVRVVLDAGSGLRVEDIDYSQANVCLAQGLCDYQTVIEHRWVNISQALWGARTDESCLAYHTSSADSWRCGDLHHIMENHITTPMFFRMDLQDATIMDNAITAGLRYGGQAVNPTVWGFGVESRLRDLRLLDSTAEEGSAMGGLPLATPGVFGPQCGDHSSLYNDKPFLRGRAPTPPGPRRTTNRLLWNWVRGTGATDAIEAFVQPGGPLQSCP